MNNIYFFFLLAFLISCEQPAPEEKNIFNKLLPAKEYEKVIIFSVDSTISCESLNYECQVADTSGKLLLTGLRQLELQGAEKKIFINYFSNLTDTVSGAQETVMNEFRDAVLFFNKKTDTIPSYAYNISFNTSVITYTTKRHVGTSLNELEPLFDIFTKRKLKSKDRSL